MMNKYLEQQQELRQLAHEIFSAANRLQEAAATILDIQKQRRDKRLLQEMLDRVTAGSVDIEDVVAFYLENDLSLDDTPNASETEATGKACTVSFDDDGKEGGKRVIHVDRPDYQAPAACED
jgi:hypothetical protein